MARTIGFTKHARLRIAERGTTEADVIRAIQEGVRVPAQRGLWLYRLNLDYHRVWSGKVYAIQQVAPVVQETPDRLTVVTIYTFYFREMPAS